MLSHFPAEEVRHQCALFQGLPSLPIPPFPDLTSYECTGWLWWIFQAHGQILTSTEIPCFNGKPEGAAFLAIIATWGLKTIGISLRGCQPKHPIVSETMCVPLKHGRAVISLASWDISRFPSPLPSHHHPAKCLQEQMLFITPTALQWAWSYLY